MYLPSRQTRPTVWVQLTPGMYVHTSHTHSISPAYSRYICSHPAPPQYESSLLQVCMYTLHTPTVWIQLTPVTYVHTSHPHSISPAYSRYICTQPVPQQYESSLLQVYMYTPRTPTVWVQLTPVTYVNTLHPTVWVQLTPVMYVHTLHPHSMSPAYSRYICTHPAPHSMSPAYSRYIHTYLLT